MPSYDPDLTSGDPYYDDFDGTKNYLKILFKPGFAVQARELTQLQTNIQTQIERFGDYIFKNGTPVYGSGLTEKNISFVRAQSLSDSNVAAIVGDVVTGTGDKANLKAKVVETETGLTSGSDTYPVLFLQYLSGGGTGDDFFTVGDEVYSSNQGISFEVKLNESDNIAATGDALACSIDDGIFYVDGFFVYVNSQTTVPYKLSEENEIEKPSSLETGFASGAPAGVRLYQYPTNRVGIQINKKIVDAFDDPTLVDPARGSYNYSAPGADRYQVDPVFSSKELSITSNTPTDFIDEDFVDVLRVENGSITRRYNRTELSGLEDTLARRTYDESGNYTVDPFNVSVLNHLRVDKYQVDVTLSSSTEVFQQGDNVYVGGSTAEVLDVLDRTNYIGATAQRLIVDMESGRFFVNETLTEDGANPVATGTITNVTFLPDPEGVYSLEQGGTSDKLALSVSPGKAYVYGYEFETQSPTNIETDRARTDDSLEGVNLNAIVGNSMIAETPALPVNDEAVFYSSNRFLSYPFDNTAAILGATGSFAYNNLPLVDLKSDYVQVNIPYRANESGRATISYWAPLFATEHNTNFDSVMVLSNFSSATMEASDASLIVGQGSGAYYLPTSLAQDGGYDATVNFAPTPKLDRHLQKIVFSQGYRSGVNYRTTKGLNNDDINNYDNFMGLVASQGVTCAAVRQIFLGKINQSVNGNAGPSAYIRAAGTVRRWIPAGTVANRRNSALIIQSAGQGGFSNVGNVIQQGWAGISGPTQDCTPVSYGSSIQSITNKSVYALSVADGYVTGQNGYKASSNFAVGDIVRQFQYTGATTNASAGGFTLGGGQYTDPGTLREAIGEVIAWILTASGPKLYIENISGVNFLPTCGFNSAAYPGVLSSTPFDDTCSGVSFSGFIDLVTTEAPDSGESIDYQFTYGVVSGHDAAIDVQQIIFDPNDVGLAQNGYLNLMQDDSIDGIGSSDFDSGDPAIAQTTAQDLINQGIVGDNYKHGQLAYQFTYNDWDGTKLTWDAWNNNFNIVNKGVVISWDPSQNKLITSICDGSQGFQRDLGYIFGMYDDTCDNQFVGYGGNGIASNTTTLSSESVIVDMEGPYNVTTRNFTGFGTYTQGETASQLLESKSNFAPGRYYTVGEKVAQAVPGQTPTGYATGTIENFTARDLGNSGDTQDTVLLIKPDPGPSFEVGFNASGILEGTVSNGVYVKSPTGRITSNASAYGLSKSFFSGSLGTGGNSSNQYYKQVPVTIGTARIRQITEVSNDAHLVSFFDVNMNQKRKNERFFLSETKSAYYGYAKNSDAVGTDNTLGGKLFNIHPNYLGKIYNPDRNSLIFEVPVGDVVKSINAMDYRAIKEFQVDFGASDEVSISSGNSLIRFVGGDASGGRVDGADLNNYIMIDNDGKIMDLLSDAFVLRTNNTDFGDFGKLTISKNTGGGTGTYPATTKFSMIAALEVNPGENVTSSPIRFKRLREYTENLQVSDVKVTSTGQYYFELDKVDIYSYNSAFDEGVGPTADAFDKLALDNGQRDNYYEKGRLYLVNNGLENFGTSEQVEDGLANFVTPIQVTYRYFEHSGVGPFVSESYINENPTGDDLEFTFDDIPVYTSPNIGDVVRLNKVIDFRPIFDGTNFSDIFLPFSGRAFNISYSYYLPRIDRLVITRDKQFKVIKGVPAIEPKSPDQVVDAMELYKFYIPAYTYNSKDVVSKFIENKRFTMRDIGKLEKRIEEIEYYSTLSLLERQTEALFIKDSNGNDRFKNGIIVDQFTGHEIGDVQNPDYNISIDFENQELHPPFISRNIDFDVLTTNSLYRTNDDVVMLPFTTESAMIQPLSTNTVNLNPFNNVSWLGTAVCNPPSDNWYDQNQNPDVLINVEGENDAWENLGSSAFGTKWNDWQSSWAGAEYNIDKAQKSNQEKSKRVTKVTRNKDRKGISNKTVPDRITKKVNDRIVDTSVIPFVRSQTLDITATNMRPNTRVYVFFDGINVSEQCTFVENGTTKSMISNPLITDEYGRITSNKQLKFTVPSGQFKTGQKLIRITDSPTNNVASARTTAEVIFAAQGILNTDSINSVNTRLPHIVRNGVNQENIVTTEGSRIARDPLSQTFKILESEYPDGVYIDSVDIYFKSKSNTLPVTLQIRPTISGYPSPTTVYPFAEVVKNPEEVNVSDTPDVADVGSSTTFRFSTPVHLAPGEHSVVLLSNSDEYQTYIAVLGENQIGTEIPVTEQPNTGVLFRSQNAGTWKPDNNSDLMFRLNRCKFNYSGLKTLTLRERKGSDNYTGIAKIDSYNLNASVVNWPNSRYEMKLRFTPNAGSSVSATSTEYPVSINETVSLRESKKVNLSTSDTNDTLILNANVIGSDDRVSPVIDLKRISLYAVENRIEGNKDTSAGGDGYNGELEPKAKPVLPGRIPRARYITRQVNLEDGFGSTNVKVLLNQYKPTGSDIQVFVKQQSEGEDTPFENVPYLQLTPSTTENLDGYQEVEYSLPKDLIEPMGKFAIKICLYADGSPNNTAIVPLVKSMRVVALA